MTIRKSLDLGRFTLDLSRTSPVLTCDGAATTVLDQDDVADLVELLRPFAAERPDADLDDEEERVFRRLIAEDRGLEFARQLLSGDGVLIVREV